MQLSFFIQRWCAANNITYINAARDDYQTRSSNIQYAVTHARMRLSSVAHTNMLPFDRIPTFLSLSCSFARYVAPQTGDHDLFDV